MITYQPHFLNRDGVQIGVDTWDPSVGYSRRERRHPTLGLPFVCVFTPQLLASVAPQKSEQDLSTRGNGYVVHPRPVSGVNWLC